MTTIVSVWAGPGAGKSTLAAKLFSQAKEVGASVELVREYVKDWAWQQRRISPYDQFYIAGQQTRKEAVLFGQVDYIITDSPSIMSAYYQRRYTDESYLLSPLLAFRGQAAKDGHRFVDLFLDRTKPYSTAGRYETEEQARDIDREILHFLERVVDSYTTVTSGLNWQDLSLK